MSIVHYEADNLITSTQKLITKSDLQLESGESVVRGEVLTKGSNGGLVALGETTDVPYTVALQEIDATAEAKNIEYIYQGSVLNSQLTYGAGSIDDFRDAFITSTNIMVQE